MSLSVFLDREEMFIFSLRMTENLIRSVTQCHDPHDMINSLQICNFWFPPETDPDRKRSIIAWVKFVTEAERE